MEKVDYILMQAREGQFGKPTKPSRENIKEVHFWNSYFGMSARYTPRPGGKHYDYVVAGKRYKLELMAKNKL